ncbi:hypothetical protein ACWYXJ_14550 [Janthinobacterium lividum]|jgi:hypothetical protein|uniref:hypothetical protein n=1 Tax=Janthinobacterium lividum TaxID=29581 RepID=UPI0039E73554
MANGAECRALVLSWRFDKTRVFTAILLTKIEECRVTRGCKSRTFPWFLSKSHSNYKVEWRVNALPALMDCCRSIEKIAQAPSETRKNRLLDFQGA